MIYKKKIIEFQDNRKGSQMLLTSLLQKVEYALQKITCLFWDKNASTSRVSYTHLTFVNDQSFSSFLLKLSHRELDLTITDSQTLFVNLRFWAMAWPPSILSTYYSFILFDLLLAFGSRSCYGFGFDIHHRYSDQVKGILGVEGLPEKGSVDYYVAMALLDIPEQCSQDYRDASF